jgi:hypothetical protein
MKVILMQKLLKIANIKEYISNGKKNKWPKSWNKCPMCRYFNKIIEYGFYMRYYINCHLGINGKIYVKRYYCKECKKTISLLPDFCIRRYILSFDDILDFLYIKYKRKISLEKYLIELNEKYPFLNLSKQQYYNYLNRLVINIPLIKSVLRIIVKSMTFESVGKTEKERLMGLLKCIKNEFSPLNNFLYIFYQHTNKSPLSL